MSTAGFLSRKIEASVVDDNTSCPCSFTDAVDSFALRCPAAAGEGDRHVGEWGRVGHAQASTTPFGPKEGPQ